MIIIRFKKLVAYLSIFNIIMQIFNVLKCIKKHFNTFLALPYFKCCPCIILCLYKSLSVRFLPLLISLSISFESLNNFSIRYSI